MSDLKAAKSQHIVERLQRDGVDLVAARLRNSNP
jgi:hypothetical protein